MYNTTNVSMGKIKNKERAKIFSEEKKNLRKTGDIDKPDGKVASIQNA